MSTGQLTARVDAKWNSHLTKTETGSSSEEYLYDDWMFPVFTMFHSNHLHFKTLKMILKIPGFEIKLRS